MSKSRSNRHKDVFLVVLFIIGAAVGWASYSIARQSSVNHTFGLVVVALVMGVAVIMAALIDAKNRAVRSTPIRYMS